MYCNALAFHHSSNGSKSTYLQARISLRISFEKQLVPILLKIIFCTREREGIGRGHRRPRLGRMEARRQQGEAEVGLVGSSHQWWTAVGRRAIAAARPGMADWLGGGRLGSGKTSLAAGGGLAGAGRLTSIPSSSPLGHSLCTCVRSSRTARPGLYVGPLKPVPSAAHLLGTAIQKFGYTKIWGP